MNHVRRLTVSLAVMFVLGVVMSSAASATPLPKHATGITSVARPLGRRGHGELALILELRKELARLHGKATALRTAIAAVSHDIETLETEITMVKGQIELAEDEIASTKRTIKTLKGDIARLKLQLRQLKRQLARLTLLVAHLQAAIERLEYHLAVTQATRHRIILSLQACVAEAEANEQPARAARCSKGIARQEAKLGNEEASIDRKIAAATSRVETDSAMIVLLENEIATKQELLASEKSALDEARGQLRVLKAALVSLRLRLRNLEERLAHLQIKLVQLEAKLVRVQTRIGRLEEGLRMLEVPQATRLATTLSGSGTKSHRGARIVVTEGTSVSDVATLRGQFTAAATGTIEYDVYSDKACTKLVATAGAVTVSGSTAPASSPQTLPAGKYYWRAFYRGDKLNSPSSSTCREIETVTP